MTTSPCIVRCGAFALAGLTALSLAACGTSGNSASSGASTTPSSNSSTSAKAASPAADRTAGIVATVAGGIVTLTGADGPATVHVTGSTNVTQLAAARLTDVKAGECLVVRPTRDAGSAGVTAAAVLFGSAEDGQCAPPGPRKGRAVIGTVASVTGSSIMLTAADNGQSFVTVTPTTRYAMRTAADPSAIVVGQCLLARGTKDADGGVDARSVGIRPSNSGPCGGKHQN